MTAGKGQVKKRRGQVAEKSSENPSQAGSTETKEEKKPMTLNERMADLLFPLFLLANIFVAGHKLYTHYREHVVVPMHEPEDFVGMRKAGRIVAGAFDHIEHLVVPGTTTLDLDQDIALYAVLNNATSAALGYKGFPKTSCISVNDVVLHGIPTKEVVLKLGDVVKLDIALVVDGWHADSCRTVVVGGAPRPATEKLVRVTEEALELGLQQCGPGKYTGDIGAAIQEHVEGAGFSVVTTFSGHGIGRKFHTPPTVPNKGPKGSGTFLKEGMFFTIEPMATIGSSKLEVLKDGWTTVTADGLYGAQFEHTVGVNATGCEIFTKV
mmetsp:Transcript_10155/g.21157  ORF Transcript_10155/g.21157 Transcript_10155/m.21157 type:complete len:323 (-) Transcript_10155:186-1154(-)|eukprot:CAMPEP_0118924718 /NCGR_PEP_ID=MMETSP1169-20130426/2722_1 /TAXON_ID=36882 /ORGANISM="Pyramimonas obovata, Strain CCMP722" /LENGTH=322 /DNA_ID=CAMNT_0006865849 /DNA_START=95 /DNA_END=1063 /DNA_ORIENTATION=+